MLLLAGCLGGSDDDAGDPASNASGESIEAQTSTNSSTTNATGNATYLQNSDYSKAHIHDYWGEASEKVIMDEVIEVNPFLSVFYTTFAPFIDGEPRASVGTAFFSLPNGSFVPEGAGELRVQVDATGSLRNGQMSLGYQAANSATFAQTDPQDAQAEWILELTPDMADLPHAKSTRWAFRLDASGAGAVLEGEVSVKMTAVKTYEIEAWPEHPDFWENGTRNKLHLANINATFEKLEHEFTFFLQEEETDAIPLPEGTIVPPETSLLLVDFWYALDGDVKNNANGDAELRAKEGSASSFYRGLWWNEVENEPNHIRYAIPVDGSNWDSPYAEESAWAFLVYAPFGVRDPTTDEAFMRMGIMEVGSGNVTVDVTAYRTVPDWLEMPDDPFSRPAARG